MTKKTITTILAFVLLIGGITAGTLLVQKEQDIREEAAPLSTISFSPATQSVVRGQTFTTNSRISTSTNKITGVDIEIVYNPAVIQLNQLVPTTALSPFTSPSTGSVIRNEINNQTGNARFIAYTLDRNLGLLGTNLDILTVTGQVLANATPASYQITYGSFTTLAAVNESQNALVSKTGYTLNVTLPTASPSPSPTASPSPSPVPTASPSPTPTRTPSPTPSPSPSPSPTPTRTPSPVPTASPSPVPTASPSPTPVVFPNWDVDQNGLINIVDIGLVVDEYGNTNPSAGRADVDRNGIVNIVDIGIIIDHYE